MKKIKTYLTEPSAPWKRGSFIGGAGLFACGWTQDNKVFMLFPDYFIIADPLTGERESMIEDDDLIQRLSKDNLEFDLKEGNQKVKVFGLRGGNGNHFTTDRWSLIEIQQESQEKIFGITDYKHFGRSENEFWKNYDLIKLHELEFGQWCGFSPDEKYFGIFGSGGAEIFYRV
ncbi:hypothetical protein [Flammeovirga sp. SJP92]|uniref:hypothetical protein n=1 Tax=Flammeovirga sp. SJP92 TaxID=1775430 RepID=UPI000787E41F|nr:hypothetical protein [Flammeovirga sp. SJP92]KXX66880.1 hypothetical protein AVL50_30590 [Flammeovirga sp. SJP92]